jgi:hypothetical protein
MRPLEMSPKNLPHWLLILTIVFSLFPVTASAADPVLEVGMGKWEITPKLEQEKPVWLAGLASNRVATAVLDPLYARALVLQGDQTKIALVSVDLLGMQYQDVVEVRKSLNEFSYVMVASTHTHEAPDVIGIWGPSASVSGVDPDYLLLLRNAIVAAVLIAEKNAVPVKASYGTCENYSLLKDFRLPDVFDPMLRVLKFERISDGETTGILVQWNSHPIEPDGNTSITRDFMGVTTDTLEKRHDCPVIYFSGAIGGLMGTSVAPFMDPSGEPLFKDAIDLIGLYGNAVAGVADQALGQAKPIELLPLKAYAKSIYVPFPNEGFRQARAVGLLARPAYAWMGHRDKRGVAIPQSQVSGEQSTETEVAYLRLGELHVAAIPGELYPEFVYGEYQDPVDAGADFADADKESTIVDTLPGPKFLMIGLANDAIGYIVPKRQWDVLPPFAYGRKSAQYGEVNSMGPKTGSVLMDALSDRVQESLED